jgi:hypothetical protein
LALSPAARDSLINCGLVEARSAGFEPSRFGLVRQQRPDPRSDLDALWLGVVRTDSGASPRLQVKVAYSRAAGRRIRWLPRDYGAAAPHRSGEGH